MRVVEGEPVGFLRARFLMRSVERVPRRFILVERLEDRTLLSSGLMPRPTAGRPHLLALRGVIAPAKPPVPTNSGPYGTPQGLPGTIEFENYDRGGEGIAYHMSGSLNDLSLIHI